MTLGCNCNYGSDGDNVSGLMSITRLDSWSSNNGITINLSKPSYKSIWMGKVTLISLLSLYLIVAGLILN